MTDFEKIKLNIEKVHEEMKAYPKARLCAVIKNRSPEEIRYAVDCCGVTLVGENRVQEFLSHEPYLSGAETHFVGRLQKNKVKYLVGRVAMIESVDSVPLAEEIASRSGKVGVVTDILCEVNTGREPQKGGFLPEELADALEKISHLKNIRLRGLMAVTPMTDSSDEKRGYFALLARLKNENRRYFSGDAILSMGMSGSYREALSEGADIIRIGTGIFGERK
ncbi:MAG: YggS family pyridoxal phosphate-dependent enzyme [Eubacteriales bacterium]|nr:YggS family pyridoxal phosphate-dependent enzyme [Eubacteriales bacterium]MCI6972201.1 YggS family pyridoxal phosphate-dependent enzyme [Eubacterium sp.]MDY5355041.1 YggS family pyridoxal phosphate-dependent enzyme [Eubacteriales bacterium]